MFKLSPFPVLFFAACSGPLPADPKPGGIDTAIGGEPTDSADGEAVDTQRVDSGPADSGTRDSGSTDTASDDSGASDTGTTPEVDLDGDGFTVEDGDCNDMDSSLHPAREEVCDGIDNNCDGVIDEDAATLWYLDFDGDGHGTDAFTYEGCTPLEGYVSLSDDCDDTTILAHPGGVEVCDTIDNDCNGEIDEDVTETYFLDEDGDSFGDAGFTIEACSLPEGYADNPEDCHDLDELIHPDADEICDGADNNCNGETDEDSATDALTFHRDADADGFGALDDTTSACSVPDGFVDDSSDCDDHDDDIHPDATEACDGEDNNCNGETDEDGAIGGTTWYPDSDEDTYGSEEGAVESCVAPPTYVSVAGDCDDTEPLTSPDGVESCNDIDDDCDGEVDEMGATGGPMWYLDSDRDGYGDPAGGLSACAAPSGYVDNLNDCDDHDDDTHPTGTEVCDGEDNDCDDEIDEDGATGAPTWYPDADEDTYGSSDGATVACSAPPGFVGVAGDCDDTLASISPASTESCNGIDDDCDTVVDEDGAAGGTTWYRDADGDGYGSEDVIVVACDVPGGYTTTPGDCDDGDGDAYPGATEVHGDGVDQDCDGEDPAAHPHTGSEPGWYHANYSGAYGDYNPSVSYNGGISCPSTCENYGMTSVGARFVCNVLHAGSFSTEGCTPSTEGMYGTANCGLMVRDLEVITENGGMEDCAGGNIYECATSSCSEGVTYHSIECQCI